MGDLSGTRPARRATTRGRTRTFWAPLGLAVLALLVARVARSAPGATSCGDGRERSADTAGHCCWPGQVWNGAACVGAPTSCPPGFQSDPHQSCVLIACDAGKQRAVDHVHCCWPGQGYSSTRARCIGAPRCPAKMEALGADDCVSVDKDHDGIPNKVDECPDDPEDFNGFEDQDGCPDEARRLAMVQAAIERRAHEAEVNAVHSLDNLGGAHYVDGVGLVARAPAPSAPPPPSASGDPPVRLPPARKLARTDLQWGVGTSWATWSVSGSPGVYSADAIVSEIWLRGEFRSIGRWVTPWFDIRPTIGVTVNDPAIEGTTYSFLNVGVSTHVGIDVQPWSFFGAGPYAGFWLDYFSVSGAGSSGSSAPSSNANDVGPELGLHARVRTEDRVGKPELFYLDGEIFYRSGSQMNAGYQRMELGVRPSYGFSFYLEELTQITSSSTPDLEPGPTATAVANTMPLQTRLGGGLGGGF